jgi:hypothetical protein
VLAALSDLYRTFEAALKHIEDKQIVKQIDSAKRKILFFLSWVNEVPNVSFYSFSTVITRIEPFSGTTRHIVK